MKLTEGVDDQNTLEQLIERSKPPIPEECAHLNFLLLTPFRYAPYPHSSRFRRAGSTDGVFYAGETVQTAVAETAFYRLLFYYESPSTPWPTNPGEYSAFAAEFYVKAAIDLTAPPLNGNRGVWTDLTDYTGCLKLADAAREQGIEAIRYQSVRDPRGGANVAILTCRAFTTSDVVDWQTWHLHFSKSGIRGEREFPHMSISFDTDTFGADPRIAKLIWDR